MSSYAVIDTTKSPQTVINVVEWDGVSNYDFHKGHGFDDGLIIIQSDIAGIGWTYDGTNFTNPNQGQ